MSAPQKAQLSSFKSLGKNKTLGIIAGGGYVPRRLVEACLENDQDFFIVAFEGQTDPGILSGNSYMLTRIGAAGRIIETLKSRNITDLVIIGAIRRPSLQELRPDMRTIRFFTKIGMRALGDDGLLSALRYELESEGFTIHGVQNFAPDLITQERCYSQRVPNDEEWIDIERGIHVCQVLGMLDIGQCVIIQEGIVLGVEGIEGTDELIRRCGEYRRKGRKGVLVKTCKPQQDRDIDLPTIGLHTLRMCKEAGIGGLVIHAGRSILVDPDEVMAYADQHKMFVIGISIENYKTQYDTSS